MNHLGRNLFSLMERKPENILEIRKAIGFGDSCLKVLQCHNYEVRQAKESTGWWDMDELGLVFLFLILNKINMLV